MPRFITIFAVLLMLFMPPAVAAEINKEGAERLKTLFSKQIEKHKKAIIARGGTLKIDGEIVVEQASDYYAVTLPAMIITNVDGMSSEIGLIAINATPTDTPDDWKMSIAIPTPILYKDKDGVDTMRLDIDAQEMGGLWNGSLENFSKLSAKYSGIKLTHFDKQEVLSIGQFNIATDLTENKPAHWSGPTKITIQNFDIAKANSAKIINFDAIKLLVEFDNFSPQRQFDALAKISSDNKENITKETSETPYGSIFKNLGDSFSFQTSINGLRVKSPDTQTIEEKGLSLQNLNLSFSAKNLQSNKIQQLLSFKYDGLKTKDIKHANDALFPDRMSLNLNLENLPLTDVITLGEKVLPSGDNNKTAKQVAAMQAMFSLPKILASAGTILTLTNTSYGNDFYSAQLNGNLKANANSIFGTTGEIIFSIKNVDDVIKKLEIKGNQQDNIKKLKAVKEVCNKQGEKEEQQTICHITLDESAKLLVNGKDMEVLLQAIKSSPKTASTEDMTTPR